MDKEQIQKNKERMAKFKALHTRQKWITRLVIIGILGFIGTVIFRTATLHKRMHQQVEPSGIQPQTKDQSPKLTMSSRLVKVVNQVTPAQVVQAARKYKDIPQKSKTQAIETLLSHIECTHNEQNELRKLMHAVLSQKTLEELADKVLEMGEVKFKLTFPIYKKAVISYIQNNVKY